MNLFIISIIILIVLFIPIPIKIKLDYMDNNLIFKTYKKTIFSSKKGIENVYLERIFNKKSKDKIKKKNNLNDNKYKKSISLRKLYRNLSNNKFKPKIKIDVSLTYGIEDAALCAILYGLLSNLPSILYFLLIIIFKVKNFSFNIKPKFNSILLSFGITSIFYFNIANIIYILYLFHKCKEFKEVDPIKGKNI